MQMLITLHLIQISDINYGLRNSLHTYNVIYK